MAEFPEIPRHRIQKKLGSGGAADVYLGIQEPLNREVAIKVLVPSLFRDPHLAKRFLKEAETAAGLRHPNIVTIHDVGQSGETYYIVMEYLAESLKDRIKQGPLGPAEALGILQHLADALGYAHAKGFVHRDIKPENIMFREEGLPVLVDFGIAKAMGTQTKLTATGMSIGTPHYMSPEQIRGYDLDGRADIYSLGVVFYEMLTGQVPYDATDTIAIAMKHVQEPIPTLPPKLAKYQPLLDRMMAKDRDERIQTGNELERLLERLELTPVQRKTESRRPDSAGVRRKAEVPIEAGDERKASGRVEKPAALKALEPLKKDGNKSKIIVGMCILLVAAVVVLVFIVSGTKSNITEQPYTPILPSKSSSYERERTADDAAWQMASGLNTKEAYQAYLDKYSSGYHSLKARNRVAEMKAKEAKKAKADQTPTTPAQEKPAAPLQDVRSIIPQDSRLWTESSTGMEFVWLPGGEFAMGSNSGESDEKPMRQIFIDGFWMGKYEVTQAEWEAVMGSNPSRFKNGGNYPVENVSWNDVQDFVQRLNNRTGQGFRLPTEAEWEYACRAGTTGDRYGNLDVIAWYSSNSGGTTNPVGQKRENAFGLFDMLGNVWEWCQDLYGSYPSGYVRNPTGPSSGSYRVRRGGSWLNLLAQSVRAPFRYGYGPSDRFNDLGFRLARTK